MDMNNLEYAKIFQQALDEQVAATATTGWMEANAGQVIYNGGKEIKIPKMSLSGLSDYSREEGHVKGSITLTYQTKEMRMDRGVKFQLDAMDVDESNFVVSATNVLSQFQKTKVIPEVDAYRYSTIIQGAIDHGRVESGYTPDPDTIMQKLLGDIAKIEDVCGEGVQLVITMTALCANILSQSPLYAKNVDVTEFKAGSFYQKLRSIDDNPIIRVPSALMKSKYIFYDGVSEGQTDGGFEAHPDAVQANWFICARRVPIAVSKTDNIRIFDPSTNQKANAWQIDYRKYHDLFIMDNAYDLIFVNTQ